MKTIMLTLIFCFQGIILFAQQIYLYQFVNNIMDTEKPVSYATFYNSFNKSPLISERIRDLTTEEGGDGYVTEVLFPIKFPVLQKHYRAIPEIDNSIRPFFGYSRLYLDYAFHARVAKNVVSSPILPPTNRFGVRYDKVFWIRKNGEKIDNLNCFNFCKVETQEIESDDFKTDKYAFAFFSLYLHHYSNGQPEGVLLDSLNRNNYIQGDFSTNFLRASLSLRMQNSDKANFGFTLGYQNEIGKDQSFLSFRGEQNLRYGKRRIIFIGQAYFSIFEKYVYLSKITNTMHIRSEVEFITDYRTLVNYPYSKQHPVGAHVYVEMPILPLPAIGLLFHYYIGRDYLNIRYDDPIQAFQIGLSLELSRFTLNPFDEEPAFLSPN